MAPIEPGTYRIVNILSKKAITVPNHDHCTIIGQPKHNESNQQWFVQRSGEGYRFKNCLYGTYITINSTEWSARAYLGQYPPTWQVLQHGEGIYIIQYGDFDRVLDMHREHEPSNGEIHIWPKNEYEPQKQWEFERLSEDTGDQGGRTQVAIESGNEQIAAKSQELAEKDRLITQQGEQLAQKNQQIIEQVAQITTQSHLIVSQSQQIAAQSRQLVEQSRELAEKSERLAQKDEEITKGYKELADKLMWVADRENALKRGGFGSRSTEIDLQGKGSSKQEKDEQREDGQNDVAVLQEKLEKLQRMVAQLMDMNATKPVNVS